MSSRPKPRIVPVVMSSDDPLTRAMAPPPNETEGQRAERLRAEAEAKRISDLIDEELNRQRNSERRGPKPIKILLLGQSESGKSTTLKNFQLLGSPKAFRAERASWRAVIRLNIVRSIRIILDAILEAYAEQNARPASTNGQPPSPQHPQHPGMPPRLTRQHLELRQRLLPLLQVEEALIHRLTPLGSQEIELDGKPLSNRYRNKEVSVTAGSAWKSALSRMLNHGGSADGDRPPSGDWDDPNDPGRVMFQCREDMLRLWFDPVVQALLRAQRLRLQEMPGFFLDSIERVTAADYIPSDDDVLRARIKTLGVTEYRFNMKVGNAVSHDWRVYDVGGQRSLRAAWVPFFDDMNAIIFLAPISCFDQVLAEDPSVNRLEDSVLLWRSIVSNPLLAKTNLVLFLNKCDVLRAKLNAGIRMGKYVISYGDRPNTFEHVSDYLRRKFHSIHVDHSPEPRSFHGHFTSVTDTKTTAVILENVTDQVVRQYLKSSALI